MLDDFRTLQLYSGGDTQRSGGRLGSQELRESVRRYQQGRTMLKHWLIDLIGHVSGLSDAQLRQIELPATKALIDLLNRAQPIIEQAQSLLR